MKLKFMPVLCGLILALSFVSCASSYSLASTPAPPQGKKWSPGHYALVYDSRFLSMVDNPALIAEFDSWVASLPPGIIGVQGGAYWRDLEKEKGVYDFRLIDIQLEICARYGKKLFCSISEKQFNMPWSPAPRYISTEYDGVVPMTPSTGQSARIWDTRVLERFCLLIDALGERYDSHPSFEGIEFMETSFSCDPKVEAQRGYRTNDYITAYITLLTRARKAFRNSVIIQELNDLPSTGAVDEITMADFVAACADIGVGIGGPDLYPDTQRNPKRRRIASYDFYTDYAGKIPLACDVQYPECAGKMWYQGNVTWFGNFTPQGLLDMGINTLRLNYIFWCAVEKTPQTRFGFTRDVLPVLAKNRWPIHTAWPESAGNVSEGNISAGPISAGPLSAGPRDLRFQTGFSGTGIVPRYHVSDLLKGIDPGLVDGKLITNAWINYEDGTRAQSFADIARDPLDAIGKIPTADLVQEQH